LPTIIKIDYSQNQKTKVGYNKKVLKNRPYSYPAAARPVDTIVSAVS